MRNVSEEFGELINFCLPYRKSPEFLAARAKVAAERQARRARRVVESEQFDTWQYQRRFIPKASSLSLEIRTRPTRNEIRSARRYNAKFMLCMAKAGKFGTKFGRAESLPALSRGTT